MQLRYTLIALLTGISIGLFGQSTDISCELSSLYRLTRSKSPTLQQQKILTRRLEVGKQFAASAFDYWLGSDLTLSRLGQNLFTGDSRISIIGNQVKTNNLGLSAQLSRNFRSGLSANIGVEYTRIGDNFPLNRLNEDVGPFLSNNNTYTSVSVRQPLLRGRGRNIATANEKIAKVRVEGQLQNATFITSNEVSNMVVGYWQYLAASRSLDIYQSNTSRVRRVLNITEELVKADRKPTSDLIQIQADLNSKEQQEVQAAQQLYAARQNLGRLIGLTAIESESLGVPLNDFPRIEEVESDITLEELLEIARQNRSDLKALQKNLETTQVSVEVSRNNIKPQLDATASLGYGGVDIGNGVQRFFTPLIRNEGRNYQASVGLSYTFPLNNNLAEATLLENELIYNDQTIQIENQMRNIELDVSIAYNNYRNSIAALEKSKQALDYSTKAFDNEQAKFQSGLTTLLNLILFQERLTFAQLDYIRNQQQFATAISNLRYETGTILPSTNSSVTNNDLLDATIFYTLPKQ